MADLLSPNVFQMRIVLAIREPPIWRRVLVPGSARLDKLHLIFQDVMGWTDSHLHAFRIGDAEYGMQLEDFPEDELDETDFRVADVLKEGDRFVYDYDFGDSWEHEVLVEKTHSIRLVLKFAVVIAGENACPPDDCGGISGYAELLEVLADPSSEEYEHFRLRAGPFDPAVFDLAAANAALQRLR
jgi:hypothetical protein